MIRTILKVVARWARRARGRCRGAVSVLRAAIRDGRWRHAVSTFRADERRAGRANRASSRSAAGGSGGCTAYGRSEPPVGAEPVVAPGAPEPAAAAEDQRRDTDVDRHRTGRTSADRSATASIAKCRCLPIGRLSGLTPLWKQPVGGGYASFVVARGRAFTIEQRGAQEVVAAYDVPTGRELWTNSWAG